MGTHCYVSSQIASHAALLSRLEGRDEAISERVDVLTAVGGECYPFAPDNYWEAESAIDRAEFSPDVDLSNPAAYGAEIHRLIIAYWFSCATAQAERELDTRDDD